jgi:hypothetical protein
MYFFDISIIVHELVVSYALIITKAGLNPVYTNGPSVEPLPV